MLELEETKAEPEQVKALLAERYPEVQEDRRRLAWSRHPHGVFVVSVLRRIAVNILAVARRLSRLGYSLETPTWKQVAEHFLLVLCDSILETEAFDAAK